MGMCPRPLVVRQQSCLPPQCTCCNLLDMLLSPLISDESKSTCRESMHKPPSEGHQLGYDHSCHWSHIARNSARHPVQIRGSPTLGKFPPVDKFHSVLPNGP